MSDDSPYVLHEQRHSPAGWAGWARSRASSRSEACCERIDEAITLGEWFPCAAAGSARGGNTRGAHWAPSAGGVRVFLVWLQSAGGGVQVPQRGGMIAT